MKSKKKISFLSPVKAVHIHGAFLDALASTASCWIVQHSGVSLVSVDSIAVSVFVDWLSLSKSEANLAA